MRPCAMCTSHASHLVSSTRIHCSSRASRCGICVCGSASACASGAVGGCSMCSHTSSNASANARLGASPGCALSAVTMHRTVAIAPTACTDASPAAAALNSAWAKHTGRIHVSVREGGKAHLHRRAWTARRPVSELRGARQNQVRGTNTAPSHATHPRRVHGGLVYRLAQAADDARHEKCQGVCVVHLWRHSRRFEFELSAQALAAQPTTCRAHQLIQQAECITTQCAAAPFACSSLLLGCLEKHHKRVTQHDHARLGAQDLAAHGMAAQQRHCPQGSQARLFKLGLQAAGKAGEPEDNNRLPRRQTKQ